MGKQSKHHKNKVTTMSYLDASTTTPISATAMVPIPNGDPTSNSSSNANVTNRVTMDPSTSHSPSIPNTTPTVPPATPPDRIDVLTANLDKLTKQVSSIAQAIVNIHPGSNPRSTSVPSNVGSTTKIDSRPPSAPFCMPCSDQSDDDDTTDENQPCPPSGQFNSNRFSCIVVDAKIKFTDMENYLSKRTLANDNTSSIERLYGHIVRSMNNAFSKHLQIMPSFRQLNRNTDFEKLFLGKLFGSTRDTCQAIFDHLGDIIKEALTSPSTIDQDRCPASYTIITANRFNSGWDILTALLQGRLAICGAEPDLGLDARLMSLTLEMNESFQSFYIKTQILLDEFRYQATDDPFVPVPKIMKKYLQQLTRCPDYVPILLPFHRKLTKHIKNYGLDNNMYKLDFSLKEIHDDLVDMKAPPVPTVLRDISDDKSLPLSNTIPERNESFSALVASLEATVSDNCYNPTICASVSAKKRCPACLIGFHNEMDCYLRGANFQPDNLQRRLKIYNKLNGEAPPSNHQPRKWNPPSLPPVHDTRNITHKPKDDNHSTRTPTGYNGHRKKPFSNTTTKTSKKEISLLDSHHDDNNEITVDDDNPSFVEPAIAAFIQQQDDFELDFDSSDHSFSDPVVCSANMYDYNNPNNPVPTHDARIDENTINPVPVRRDSEQTDFSSDEYGHPFQYDTNDSVPTINLMFSPTLCTAEATSSLSNLHNLHDAWNCQPIYRQSSLALDHSPQVPS